MALDKQPSGLVNSSLLSEGDLPKTELECKFMVRKGLLLLKLDFGWAENVGTPTGRLNTNKKP